MPTRPRPPLDREGLWNYAARLLSGRALSVAELRTKLSARAAAPADVDGVLERLHEMQFVDDRRFADAVSLLRRDGAGVGKARVLRELARRRVPRPVAEAAAREAYSEVDEVSHARAFLRRKLRIADPAAYFADPKKLQSAFRKLRYNGFSSDAAIKALRQWSSAAESLEDDPDDDPSLSG